MAFRDLFFRPIHKNKLIYNCCWEDPRCDLQLLDLDSNSDVLMITSAGCNALHYLLGNPQSIHCVDLNYRQNAVLDLKMALFRNGDYELLWEFFGEGRVPQARQKFRELLSQHLSPASREFWERKIHYFQPGTGIRKSFYYRGASGLLAWLAKKYLSLRSSTRQLVNDFFESETLDRQREVYHQLVGKLTRSPFSFGLHHPALLSLAGVPISQRELLDSGRKKGTIAYLEETLGQTFTQLPSRENYFYKLYWEGKYNRDCCPSYLREENFDLIRSRVDRIHFEVSDISQYLDEKGGPFSHFVLLDHMDWMVKSNRDALNEEWGHIARNGRAGAKVLFRTAASDFRFLPEITFRHFALDEEKGDRVAASDRVGMYRRTGLMIRKSNSIP